MIWQHVTEIYTASLVVMSALCSAAAWVNKSEGAEVFAFASLLIVFTILSRMVSSVTDMPWSAAIWPPQDVTMAVLASVMWTIRRNAWKAAVAVLFALQCGAHLGYWGGVVVSGEAADGMTLSYLWIINAVFLLEVAVMGVAGGGIIGRALRERRSLLLHRRAGGPENVGCAR